MSNVLFRTVLTSAALASGFLFVASAARAAEDAVVLPRPAVDSAATQDEEIAVLAGGCFWGVQAVYQHTTGVIQAVSGYSGGSQDTASYEQVGTGRTGHAESVQVRFDPKKISYGKI